MPQNRIHSYYFARLNLLSFQEEKQKFIFDTLGTNVIEELGKFKYGFFEPNDIEFDGEAFVNCKLVKYKPILEGEAVDESLHKVVEDGLQHGVVAKSDFFLHYNSGVVAFHPIVNKLSISQFRTMFGRIIEATHHQFFVQAQLSLIEELYKIQSDIKKFQTIKKITFDIHPTNPSASPIYKSIDDRLKKLEAENYRASLIGKEGGLNQDALLQDDAYKSLLMAADGFGRGTLEGKIDNRNVTITTDESPIRKDAIFSESLDEMLHQLIITFKEIWKRTQR
jgi:hypothetical protein